MKNFKNIRDFFWPLLEPEHSDKLDITDDFSLVKNWEEKYKLLKEVSSREDDRLKSVESKSSIFIGTMSVATSIIVASLSALIKADESGKNVLGIYIISSILIIYLLRTLWFSVKTQKRGVYAVISVNEICKDDTDSSKYYEAISNELIKAIRINQKTINAKVDSMVMAHEYFKRAIWIIGIYAFSILLLFLDSSSLIIDFIPSKVNWNEISQWGAIGISFILSLVSVLRNKSK